MKKHEALAARTDDQFIVAEVSKNWIDGRSSSPLLLCQLFERVIAVNLTRGYRLHSFQLHRVLVRAGDSLHAADLNETIIAVFERVEGAEEGSGGAVNATAPDQRR